MKYLKITQHNQAFFDMLKENPRKMAAPLRAHYKMLKKMKEEGKFLDAWFVPGDGRCFFLFDFDSESEIDNSLLLDPMNGTFDSMIYPAVPLFEHIENALKTME